MALGNCRTAGARAAGYTRLDVMNAPASELPKVRRHTGWKVAGLIAAGAAVLVGAYAIYIHAVADRRWAEMEKSLRELREDHAARNVPRPVLRGEAVPGYAWDDYTPALQAMKGVSSVLGDFITRSPKADRAKVEALFVSHAAALDGLRKGAQRADGIYRMKWEDGFSADIPGLLQSQNLVNLAAARARVLAEEGKPREAADLLLDAAVFARDLGYNQLLISEMISCALYGIVLEDLRDLILSGKLSAEDLSRVERELDSLDRSFPRNSDSMLNEALAAGFQYTKAGVNLGELVQLQGGAGGSRELSNYLLWSVLLPGRLTCADAYFIQLDFMKRYAGAGERSWSAVQAENQRSQAEIGKLRNPLASILLPGLTSSHRAGRERRTHLRLLRVAARYRATGEILSLEDPFGTKLQTSETGGKLKVWGVGRDGVDDGGQGQWKIGNGDIVVEIEK